MKANWQRPQVLRIDETSATLGHCVPGTSATASMCIIGDATATGSAVPHACMNGGYAEPVPANCSVGGNYV